jgi:hypothetical protein
MRASVASAPYAASAQKQGGTSATSNVPLVPLTADEALSSPGRQTSQNATGTGDFRMASEVLPSPVSN